MAKWLHPLTRTASYGVTNVKNVSTTWIFLLIFIYWFICLLNTDLRSKALAKRTRKFAKPELAYGLAPTPIDEGRANERKNSCNSLLTAFRRRRPTSTDKIQSL